MTVSFQLNGSQLNVPSSGCRIRFEGDRSVVLLDSEGVSPKQAGRQHSNAHCAIGAGAKVAVRADGVLEAAIPIAFLHGGRYKLFARTGTTAWVTAGDYQLDEVSAAASLGIQLTGVTPTQAVLAFTPPSDTDTCQIQVTSANNESGWDYSILVPDTDPAVFPGADNASLFDADSAPQNRGFALADGTLAIVIGKRAAEYSPNTFKMHSRALQAATPHQAFINCVSLNGEATNATIDFATANIMPGISYSDPLPADPDRPGEYAYPTLSWTNRNEGAVDPQTGVMIRPVTLPGDIILGSDFAGLTGAFGAPIAAFPNRSLPASSVFVPANLSKSVPSYFRFSIDQGSSGWGLTDFYLSSFLPGSLKISCPLCADTPVTVCLTADGISCAFDKNYAGDPNAPIDVNMKAKGVLGVTVNCTGLCTLPLGGDRWKDASPILAAWHPNYMSGAPNTVLPNFQFDSVKLRKSSVQCNDSALVYRRDQSGAPFNPLWRKGTPVFIDSTRYTINQVTDENSIQLNETCPSSAQNLIADTFGLLITAPVPISRVVTDPWEAKITHALTTWDSAGDLQQYTNCSRQPVIAGGQTGWHCQLGGGLYWIAADGSSALPLGVAGLPYRADLGNLSYCGAAYWDDLDGNSLYCLTNTATLFKHTLLRMTFKGDHAGLESARYLSPDLGGGARSYLPLCKSTNPPVPNNCWSTAVVNATGTNTPFILEDAVRDGALDAWNNSAFPAAMKDGAVYSYIPSKLDDNHWMVTAWLSQNSYGFSGVLELSTPRGTVRMRSVLPSWRQAANTVPGAKTMRWAGIHNSAGDPWGTTRVGYFPTFFRTGSAPGQGPYYSSVVATAPVNCPPGTSGACISVTVEGQPGDPDPSRYDPVNDGKTGKPGFGYLQDLAVGDLICVPGNGDYYGSCTGYIAYNGFEHLRVLATSAPESGAVILTLQRSVGKTAQMPLPGGQKLYMMPSLCDYTAGYGCGVGAIIWDWSNGSIEQFSVGGEGHQFTNYDPVNKQVASIIAGADFNPDPSCYSSTRAVYPNCYSVFTGAVDAAKTLTAQLPGFSKVLVAQNPPFAIGTGTPGLTGMGTPNDVDSHPSGPHLASAPNAEKIWFLDGRPFLGFYTTPLATPVRTAPDVYRFAGGVSGLEIYKRLPVMASCGIGVLREVKTISNQTPYAYCVAVNRGDCATGSNPGDSYVSCPSVNPAAKPSNACPFAGIGSSTPEVRDTCLASTGPYTMGLSQVGFTAQRNGIWTPLNTSQLKRSTRLLTHGFSRYRIVDQYLNAKATPDGGVMLFRAAFMGGYSTQILMAKIPPFPDITLDTLDRRSYIATPVAIDAAPPGADSVRVQFGYDSSFRCTARNEPCEARDDFDATGVSTPFYFASEADPGGLNCAGGCQATVSLPGISQRVIFYRFVYRVNGAFVTGPPRVVVVPDPMSPGN